MKMLAGVYPGNSFEGSIYVGGEKCNFKSVLDAQKVGVAMIPQDLNMVNEMSVAENLFMGNYPTKAAGAIDFHTMFFESQKIIESFGLNVKPQTLVKDIGIAQKQLIVIARAMYNDAKVLLLDEPTSTLSDKECQILFKKVEELKKKNIGLIYISHRLEEVRMISDVITVMRNGKIVGTESKDDMTDKKIVSMMVGREVDEVYPEHNRTSGEVVLKVNDVTIHDPKSSSQLLVDGVSFELKKGEILSMYGLVGAGRTETALAMIGAFNGPVLCDMEIKGKKVRIKSPSDAVKHKVGFLPEDRKRLGVVDISSVGKNITMSSLKNLSQASVIDEGMERNAVDNVIKKLSIKTPTQETLVRTLSGGNAQKCVLGRWISADSEILILDEATQGIDVEAKTQIYYILDDLAKQGKAILFISSDLSEVIGISDRIITMKHGKIINITDGKKAERNKILWEATIGSMEENANEQ